MHFTVNHLLENPIMEQASVLAGDSAISTCQIDSVSVIEIPVEDFVRKNEFVLSTAIGCNANPSLFLSFVRDVHESGASGLAIAVGRHVESIPKEVINYSIDHNFPLIELPWEIRFSDITRTIFEKVHEWQQNSFQKTDQIQRELLQLFLDGETLDRALQVLSTAFGTRVYISRPEMEPIFTPSFEETSNNPFPYPNEPSIILTQDGARLQITPIQMFNRQIGILVLESTLPSTPPIAWNIVEQTITTLHLWFQKEQSVIDKKNKEKEKFIEMLTNGEWTSWEDIERQGNSLGLDITTSYVCIVGTIESIEETTMTEITKNSLRERFVKKTLELSEVCADSILKKIICSFQRDHIILFLEATKDEARATTYHFLDMIEQQLEVQGGTPHLISWGIGENHAGYRSFHQSYKDARIALEIGRSYNGPGYRSTYANTGIFRLLSTLAQDTSTNEMVQTTIGQLVNYSRNRNLDLLQTLTTYLQCQGNVSQTSRALALHRQSLLYRLRKIETLTGRSLTDPDDLFLLQLCSKLWSLRFKGV
ncbi:hypothetical protein BKP37_10275 [Anaerobacillus alkalilacustris]|uniref:PucR family transcriptional regulator n=1 Tax=Anaerobacillus alkalilacustris TaxID=393763 RepID=A0A1S2LMF0_9BACI|nr:PucR family transcriptional regulator [Anaerobacillus alkalilacustris]OIJ13651.1 hypothetical protein BKP37_10275 [Anaerobacillus alkalilacustris]